MSARSPIGAAKRRFSSIPGFSDQRELPRVAKLRLGVRVQNGTKDHPRETDHFVLDVEESVAPEVAEEIRGRFVQLYGERAQILSNVVFISADREQAFSSGYEMWGNGKLRCHGNGDEALRKDGGEWKPWSPCANTGCPDYQAKRCSMQSRLRFMLPDVTVLGYFQIDTGSIYSSANLRNGINLLEALTTQAFGAPRIHSIPLILARVPEKIEFDGKLNEHFILHLTPKNLTFTDLKELGPAPAPRLIVAPATEDDMPVEQVPESEQLEITPVDEETRHRIDHACKLLGLNAGTRAALESQFPQASDLVVELERRWLALPKAERDKRKKEQESAA